MRLVICTLKSKGLATPNWDFFIFFHCIICLQSIGDIVSVPPEDKRSVTQVVLGERWRQKPSGTTTTLHSVTDTHQTDTKTEISCSGQIYKPQVVKQSKHARLTETQF